MIAAIVAYLETNKAALGLKLIGGAAEFQAAAEANPAAVPAAFVITLDESAGPSLVVPVVEQRVAVNVGIVLVVRNVSDATGAASQVDMEALRAKVKAKLLGWSPADGCDALERSRSHLLAFKQGHMWWQDAYTTAFLDRSQL